MGLTFRKRDDFDKMMDDLGVSTVDLVIDDENKTTSSTDKKDDPFAKFLKPKSDENKKEKNELKS
ncbi:SPJ_0845 family protein [Lactococcus allomyrinae]|uniref:Uncharacterized protein n=1 Tax=Lactococcus allomyrinae TaxID=2419773 RepID=A0A387BF79_9LACT|nr:SPJ_0845 family protein [Lactococcus allomyrinae]AYG00924.1 hypothetical protein D7I46_07355 [Lactococcus allomyrinae]